MKKFKIASILLSFTIILFSCQSMNNLAKGGLIGTGAGAALGAGIGKIAGNTAAGAIIGAAVGGSAGVLIGRYMDKQVEEMQRDLQNAKVERVGEGIKITFDSGILFQVNKSDLSLVAQNNLNDLAVILNKYPDTYVAVEGHTDDTGSNEYNQKLSEKRARNVSIYLMEKNVLGGRISSEGYGEERPVVANTSSVNRALNRRVEISIYANEKLKEAAEKGQI